MASNADRLPFVGRAIYSFQAQFDGELSLVAGDLVLVTKVQDEYWYVGKLGGSEGRFPRSNVTGPVPLPSTLPGQPYFATLADFYEQEAGDLSFRQGEILVGIKRIDDNWWYGRASNLLEGNFPTSYVWQIEFQTVKDSFTLSKFRRRRARVIQDLVPQLPEELSLTKGEEVIVTGEAEDGWYYGECNGRSGTFPRGFVTLLSEDEPVKQSVQSNGYSNLNNHVNQNRPYGIAVYDYRATHADELNLQMGQTVYLLRHVNNEWIEGETTNGQRGMFPTSYIQIVNDCDRTAERISSQQNAKEIDLLLDFDPLLTGSTTALNHNTLPVTNAKGNLENTSALIDWTTPSGSRYMNLDNLITRNLNQLELNQNTHTGVKQRPSSWSQELTMLQIESSFVPRPNESHQAPPNERKVLPKIPPRLHESRSFSHQQSVEFNVTEVAQPNQSSEDIVYENTAINKPSATDVRPPRAIEKSSEIHEGGAPLRASYIRPAPPPPTQQANLANPSLERQHSSSSNESCIRPHRPAPCIPTDAGDRVEGRRKRAEMEKARKEEEEMLRDFEMRKKILEQRQNVITELLVTEREYCRDLRLTCQVFQLHDSKHLESKGIDVKTLFGNIYEVIRLSESFIDQLNECTREGADPVVQSIGNCFIRNEPEFRRIYSQYCINHDNAQNLLEKYETVPSINRILDEGILTLRQQIICFNMGSVIIKPVQRIMKYPLMLNELIKSTENDHPDKNQLMIASSLMTAVATHINESKRKKEIVLKYRDTGLDSEKLSRKISRLNMHSVAKKSSRLGMLLKTSIGMAPSTKDEAFEDIEAHFSEMVRTVHTVLRDIIAVCEQLKTTSKCQFDISEAVASFYGEGSRLPVVDNFRTAHRIIYQQHWNSFENYVIQHVRNPLTALCETCAGPERLVGKRRDKLLDANIASEKVAKNRDPAARRMLEEEENIARNTYLALNGQLMEELPIITEHGFNIYRRCLSSFLYARKLLVGRITKALLDLNGMPDIANLEGEITSDFNIAHIKAVDHLSRVSFISKSFRSNNRHSLDGSISPLDITPPRIAPVPTNSSPQTEGLVVQSREMINLLRTKYHPDQLYMVTGRCDIKEPLDLSANTGLIVSVVKREDPMGNSARWFVDAGEVRGFLPAKNLSPAPQSSSGTSRLLRPESAASVASLGLSATSGTSNSSESLREVQQLIDSAEEPANNNENFYDLPPSYEEALSLEGATSPHRYCEIDDIATTPEPTAAGPAPLSPEKAESPIYADIEEVLATKEDEAEEQSSSNESSVYKVDYTFQRTTLLEISLEQNELVTVLAKHDEAGNSEWWLVENDNGLQGYAPASYLSPLLPTTSM